MKRITKEELLTLLANPKIYPTRSSRLDHTPSSKTVRFALNSSLCDPDNLEDSTSSRRQTPNTQYALLNGSTIGKTSRDTHSPKPFLTRRRLKCIRKALRPRNVGVSKHAFDRLVCRLPVECAKWLLRQAKAKAKKRPERRPQRCTSGNCGCIVAVDDGYVREVVVVDLRPGWLKDLCSKSAGIKERDLPRPQAQEYEGEPAVPGKPVLGDPLSEKQSRTRARRERKKRRQEQLGSDMEAQEIFTHIRDAHKSNGDRDILTSTLGTSHFSDVSSPTSSDTYSPVRLIPPHQLWEPPSGIKATVHIADRANDADQFDDEEEAAELERLTNVLRSRITAALTGRPVPHAEKKAIKKGRPRWGGKDREPKRKKQRTKQSAVDREGAGAGTCCDVAAAATGMDVATTVPTSTGSALQRVPARESVIEVDHTAPVTNQIPADEQPIEQSQSPMPDTPTKPETLKTPKTPTSQTPSNRASTKTCPYFTAPSTPTSTTTPTKPKPRNPRTPHTPISKILFPPLSATHFGLIQELLAPNPFHLLLAVILLNKTTGTAAIPTLYKLIDRFPTPEGLAATDAATVLELIGHLGLQNARAKTIVALARAWCEHPPSKGRRYRTLHYPCRGDGCDIRPGEVLGEDDARGGAWEIAHLPGVGAYALDSWRIFCRDELRGVGSASIMKGIVTNKAEKISSMDMEDALQALNPDDIFCSPEDESEKANAKTIFEPEWKRVLPLDKELRAYLKWMWLREGQDWDPLTGKRKPASNELLERVDRGGYSMGDELLDLADRGEAEDERVTVFTSLDARGARPTEEAQEATMKCTPEIGLADGIRVDEYTSKDVAEDMRPCYLEYWKPVGEQRASRSHARTAQA